MPALFTLKTKRNNCIPVFGKVPCDSPAIQQITTRKLQTELGNTNERTIPNNTYNCHGFTFIGKAGHIGSGTIERNIVLPDEPNFIEQGIDYELASQEIETILKDSNLVLKASVANLRSDSFYTHQRITKGDIVIYRDAFKQITHSGIVYSARKNIEDTLKIMVLSKISVDQGEFFHSIKNQCILEMYGTICEIWSDSK